MNRRNYEDAAIGLKEPTIRHRWTAFYRLWRLASSERDGNDGATVCTDIEVSMAFRLILGPVAIKWLKLVEEDPPIEFSLYQSPEVIVKTLIKNRLKQAKRKRLWGGSIERYERDLAIANKLHEQGVEMTPEEVATHRNGCIRKMRQLAMERGLSIPISDEAIWEMLRRNKS